MDAATKRQLILHAKHFAHQLQLTQESLRKPRPAGIVPMVDVLTKPVKSGNVWLEHFEISPSQATIENLRYANDGHPELAIAPGKYVKLMVDGQTMMSDVPMEMLTNAEVINRAKGRVFIAGLGMGMILIPILASHRVKTVTVVESNLDVLKIVLPQLQAYMGGSGLDLRKLKIIHCDVLKYIPQDGKFDTIYFDIWPTVSGENWPEMRILENRFRKFLKSRGWMSSWRRDKCRRRWNKVQRDKKMADAAVGGDPLRNLADGFEAVMYAAEMGRCRRRALPPKDIEEVP